LLLVAAREYGGNDAIERLYMSIGSGLHGRPEGDMNKWRRMTEELLSSSLEAARLPERLREESLQDPRYEQILVAEHASAVNDLGAFGVPSLRFGTSDFAVFGPVIDPVPLGDEAVKLFEHLYESCSSPYLWEIKRTRNASQDNVPVTLNFANLTIEPARVPA
jgi:hypothetical protein